MFGRKKSGSATLGDSGNCQATGTTLDGSASLSRRTHASFWLTALARAGDPFRPLIHFILTPGNVRYHRQIWAAGIYNLLLIQSRSQPRTVTHPPNSGARRWTTHWHAVHTLKRVITHTRAGKTRSAECAAVAREAQCHDHLDRVACEVRGNG